MVRTYMDSQGVHTASSLSRDLDVAAVLKTEPVQALDAKDWLADSAEELTFQFSEKLEAENSKLEERSSKEESAVHKKERTLLIKDVKAVIRMLEGRTAYDSIRRQARIFAEAFTSDPERAMSLLSLNDMDSSQRYAILQLTLSTLDKSGRTKDLDGKLNRYLDETVSGDAEVLPALAARRVSDAEPVDSSDPQFFDILDTRPTVRAIFEAAAALSDSKNLEESILKMQAKWPQSTDFSNLEQMGGFILINRVVEGVRTLIHHVKDLHVAIGVVDTQQMSAESKHARLLLEMANTALPSGVIDKLITALLASIRNCPRCKRGKVLKQTCTCKDLKQHVLSLLYRKTQSWPELIWGSIDYRTVVLELLIKKQKRGNILPWAV